MSTITHQVIRGDTLSEIASQHGVSLAQVIDANPDFQSGKRNINLIHCGEVLNIPTVAAASPQRSMAALLQGAVPSYSNTEEISAEDIAKAEALANALALEKAETLAVRTYQNLNSLLSSSTTPIVTLEYSLTSYQAAIKGLKFCDSAHPLLADMYNLLAKASAQLAVQGGESQLKYYEQAMSASLLAVKMKQGDSRYIANSFKLAFTLAEQCEGPQARVGLAQVTTDAFAKAVDAASSSWLHSFSSEAELWYSAAQSFPSEDLTKKQWEQLGLLLKNKLPENSEAIDEMVARKVGSSDPVSSELLASNSN